MAQSSAMLVAGKFSAAQASAIVKRTVVQGTDAELQSELVALAALRKGTERQVRNFLIWHARLGDLHPAAMVQTALHATGHSIPLNSVKIAREQLTMCDACKGGKMTRAPKAKKFAVPRYSEAEEPEANFQRQWH